MAQGWFGPRQNYPDCRKIDRSGGAPKRKFVESISMADDNEVPQSVIQDTGVYSSKCGYCKKAGSSVAHGERADLST